MSYSVTVYDANDCVLAQWADTYSTLGAAKSCARLAATDRELIDADAVRVCVENAKGENVFELECKS